MRPATCPLRCLPSLAGMASPAASAAERFNLPEGPGRDLVYGHCQTCHDLQSVVDSAGIRRGAWNAVLDNMKGFGLRISADQRATDPRLSRHLSRPQAAAGGRGRWQRRRPSPPPTAPRSSMTPASPAISPTARASRASSRPCRQSRPVPGAAISRRWSRSTALKGPIDVDGEHIDGADAVLRLPHRRRDRRGGQLRPQPASATTPPAPPASPT